MTTPKPTYDELLARVAHLEQQRHPDQTAALATANATLRERVKELHCLYGISALVELPDLSLSALLERIVLLIPLAWQFPEIAEARITLGEQTFQTKDCRETAWNQVQAIKVSGKPAGQVQVCYVEERPASAEGPFLAEERKLLNVIAERVGRIVEHKRAVADRRELQAQLHQAQKMEAVGQLAGGIAHDFNNLLAAMTLQLNMLQLQSNLPPDELKKAVTEILESVNRAANLTKQLLLFSRRQTMKTSRHDANVLLRNLTILLRHMIEERVGLALELSDTPLWIEGDAGMIEQVVTNLCLNSRDAMPQGGRLTITTCLVVFGDETAARQGAARSGRFVCLRVCDTGCGMDPEVLEHIFEPFFTTKPQGKGTGLGLATVHGIVAKHGGFVEVESRLGKGSTFSVYLPNIPAATAGEQS